MIKVGQLYRKKIIDLFVDQTQKTDALLFIDFQGLDANSLNNLRLSLLDRDARLLVGKNSLMKKAFEQSKKETASFLGDQTAVVYSFGDVVPVIKALVDFSGENDKLQVKGGIIKDRQLDSNELKQISKLPPRQILLGMLANCMISPLSSFVSGLNQIILKFLWAIEEVRKQKEQKG